MGADLIRRAALVVAAGVASGATWAWLPVAEAAHGPRAVAATAVQSYAHYPYDGSWTFVRIHTNGFGGGYGRFGRRRGGGGWLHDYPDAERNFSKILAEFTQVDARIEPYGGNILAFEDPELLRYPIAYVSEPDEWRTTPEEAAALRTYLLKGGFVIFDDFFEYEMPNLVAQMSFVFPELSWIRLDGTEPVWDSFFTIEPAELDLRGPRKEGIPAFYGLYENNDKRRRMLAIAGAGADIGDLWEWSDRGYFPIDPTNEAYWIGINYVIFALTH